MTTRPFNLTDAERRRVERVDELVALGANGITELLLGVSDPSWTVRRTVVAALAVLGDDAVAPLTRWLVDARTTENGIAAAVDALSASTGTQVTPAMVELLAHPRPAIAADAAQVLGRRRALEAATRLAHAVEHPDDNVAVAAIEALGSIGSGVAIDALIEVLAKRSFFRTFPALQVLSRSSDPRVVPPIASLLDDERYRTEAARALGRTGHPHAVEPLAGLLTEQREEWVRVVAESLSDLIERASWTGATEQVVATMQRVVAPWRADFAKALITADASVCKPLASVLGWIGDASVLPVLAGLLDDPDVRTCALASIQRIVRADPETLLVALANEDPALRAAVLPVTSAARASEPVRRLLHDPDPEIRARSCEALGRIGDATAVPVLFEVLGDPNPRVGHAATAAIHSLGSDQTPALAVAALRHGTTSVRRHALRIVAYLGIDEAFEGVRAAVSDPDPRVAELAISALGKLSLAEVTPLLVTLASDPRESIRAATMRAMVERDAPESPVVLERGLADEAAWVRYYACQGLGRLGHASATAAVIERLGDDTAHVRIAALEALGHLGGDAAWQALSSAARSNDDDVRRAALASLGSRPDETAAALLLEAARSRDLPTRLVALSGLAKVGGHAALTELARATRDSELQVCEAALSLLAERADAEAAETLIEIALEMPPEHAVHATVSRPSPARIAAIEARLASAHEVAATTLVAALARMSDDQAIEPLYRALAVANPAARRAAASALAVRDTKRARELVARLAKDDPDPEVRRVCAAAVGG